MEKFSSITFEALLSGAWVDISSDVMKEPAPHGSRGMLSNDPEKRVADPGRLTFSLKNGKSNSAGLLGYYSPGHANVRAGWAPGVPIRLTVAYKGFSRVKWYGYIETDGIKVIPGVYGPRRVDVTCVDFMGEAAIHRCNLIAAQTNITVKTAMETLLANLAIQPLSTDFTTDSVNAANLVYVFDNFSSDTTAISEINKIAISKRTYIFLQDHATTTEKLVVGNPGFQTSIPNITTTYELLLETGDHLLLESGFALILDETEQLILSDADFASDESDISYGKDVYNFITTINYPRRVDAAATTVLYNLQSPTSLAAGASVTVRVQYLDPSGGNTKVNGTAMVTPVSGTDYKANANADGSGADRTSDLSVSVTFGAAEAEVILTNTSGVNSLYVGGGTAGAFFKLRGKGIYLYDPTRVAKQDATSIAAYGLRPMTMDLRYSETADTSKSTIAQNALSVWKDPHYAINKLSLLANRNEKNMYAFIFALLRYTISVSEQVTSLSVAHYLQGYDFEIIDGTKVKWYPIFKQT